MGSKELNLTVATINCDSSNNKADNIADYIFEQDLDICCLTETWLKSDDTVTIGELCPYGYEYLFRAKIREVVVLQLLSNSRFLLCSTVLKKLLSAHLST